MPQDKRRSTIRYRSFVTCDNPKGVVECGTIRKSKINKQQQNFKVVVEGDKKQENPSSTTSLAVIKEGKKEMMCIQDITREELSVSKPRCDKMNHVINSWSNGKSEREDIAKDLLRGAFDLQESLVMLGKLQEEASSLMSKSSRKQKGKSDQEGRFDGMVYGLNNNAVRAEKGGCMQDEKLRIGFQRPRKSSDEMKKAVKDSLLRQNVITNPIFEEHFDHRMRGCSDMPSTSSSQSSSVVRSSNFVPSDSSSSSTVSQRRKKKESNLIVRLMGLESPPSSPRWREEGDRMLNLSKPVYGVDSPRATKCQYNAHGLGTKQRTVEEILETLHFKGLLRSRSRNWMTPDSAESDVFTPKNGWYDERPPIVIMKPLCYSSRDLEEPIVPNLRRKEVIKPTSSRRSVEEKISNTGEKFSEEYRVTGVEYQEGCKSIVKAGFAKAFFNLDRKPKTKQEAPKKSVEVEKVSPTRRKGAEKKDATFREELKINDQEKSKTSKSNKQRDGRSISEYHTSSQQNVTSTSIFDHRKQEICDISGQRRKNRQPALVEENMKYKGKVKERQVANAEENATTCDNNFNFNTLLQQNRPKAYRNQIRDYEVEAIEYRRNDKTSVCDIPMADAHEHCNEYDDNQSCYSEITSVSTSEHCIVGPLDENQSPVCEVTLVTTHENGVAVQDLVDKAPASSQGNGTESSRETRTWSDSPTTITKLQTLLLSNPSFLRNLEEHFDLQVYPESVPYANEQTSADVGSARLLIDYANEVMKLKSSELSQAYLPQAWMNTKNPRNLVTVDQVLDDISNGIEDLKCYHISASDDNISSDNLYLLLDRDLSYKGGMWEIGWRRMCSKLELERVISDVGKHILGKLIEEAVSNFIAM